MLRCAVLATSLASALIGGAGMLASSSVQAQAVPRQFPAHALRGELVVVQAPEILLNGKPARLSPGSRLRGTNNLLVMTGAVVGQALLVHYTIDTYGLVHDVWILSDAERDRSPWPSTRDEAARWQFDPVAQVWARR